MAAPAPSSIDLNLVARQSVDWLTVSVFTAEVGQQLIAAALILLFSLLLARLCRPRVEATLTTSDTPVPATAAPPLFAGERSAVPAEDIPGRWTFTALTGHFLIGREEAIFLISGTGLLWLGAVAAQQLTLPFMVLRLCVSLTTAWAVTRFGVSAIRSRFWASMLAYCIWAAATLEILGLLPQLLHALDKASVTLGNQRFSLLLLLKGIAVFVALLWLSALASGVIGRSLDRAQTINSSQKVLLQKLTRILLFIIALLVGLNVAGIDLTVLAVFGGAVGVGLGFGMQRVFANLISGFILLVDKSIKPGDVVAIADTYGWVNRLGARYVSILTRDGKEHLIPNEKLITEQVENWSYSDDKVRLHIPIGVSYKSDVHLVRQLLLETAMSLPRVLKSPKPICLLTEFAENRINFEVRIWIRDPINGVTNMRSALYFAIWDVFKQNGIELPYPQRDVHLKTDELRTVLGQLNGETPHD